MVKRIDEEAIQEMLAGNKKAKDLKDVEEKKEVISEEKNIQNQVEKYKKNYFVDRPLEKRVAVYIDKELHGKLNSLTNLNLDKIPLSAFVTNILIKHLIDNEKVLDKMFDDMRKRFIKGIKP